MSKKERRRQAPPPHARRWRWLIVPITLVVAFAAGALWWGWGPGPATGSPRLVVDRAEVDLGYLRFETPARVEFALTNTGDGRLEIAQSPPVEAVVGC